MSSCRLLTIAWVGAFLPDQQSDDAIRSNPVVGPSVWTNLDVHARRYPESRVSGGASIRGSRRLWPGRHLWVRGSPWVSGMNDAFSTSAKDSLVEMRSVILGASASACEIVDLVIPRHPHLLRLRTNTDRRTSASGVIAKVRFPP